ncbi:hypothetical protein D3C71_1958270 [compost metagenome]
MEGYIGAVRVPVRKAAADGFDGNRSRCPAEEAEYLGVINQGRLHELEGGLHLAGLGSEAFFQPG